MYELGMCIANWLSKNFIQIRDYSLLVNEIAKMVRSGGMIDLSEYDFRTYDSCGQLIEVDEFSDSPPHYSRWMKHVRKVIKDKGGDVDCSNKLLEFVTANPAFERVVPTRCTPTRYWLWNEILAWRLEGSTNGNSCKFKLDHLLTCSLAFI